MATIEASAVRLPPWLDPKGLERVCWFDEDATTLAVEAARGVLFRDAAKVFLVSRRVVRENGFEAPDPGVFARVLGIPSTRVVPVLGTSHAADAGLREAGEAADESGKPVLLVAAEAPDPAAAVAHRLVSGGQTPDLGVPATEAGDFNGVGALLAMAGDAYHEAVKAGATKIDETRFDAFARFRTGSGRIESVGAYVSGPAYEASGPARYRLAGSRCLEDKAHVHFPPRDHCTSCGAATETHTLKSRGKVYAGTVIGKGGAPTEFFEQQKYLGAYGVAVVELEDGPRVALQVTDAKDPGNLDVGQPVRIVLRRLYHQDGQVRYGVKASVLV